MIVREPAVAGAFYPLRREELDAQVRQLMAAAAPSTAPAPKVLIVPHAGYVYSGSTAADGYATVLPAAKQISRVVLLGPCHRVAVRGLASCEADAWRTPLGIVPIEVPNEIAGLPQVIKSANVHRHEHSLEVQVPFLQTVLGDFTLIPLAVGSASAHDVADVLDAVWGGPETLIVISSDLSHYLPYAEAVDVDRETLAQVTDAQAIDHQQACGASPVNGALEALRRRGAHPELIRYRNSGDTAGSRDRVVGYAALKAGELGAAS